MPDVRAEKGYKDAEVDIYQYPTIPVPNAEKRQLTIGDLHANPLKLLHFLLREGAVSLSADDYAALVVIYRDQSSPLTQDAYQRYTDILGRMRFNEDSVSLVRLIGDELADRGKNDLLVLALLKAMKDKNVPYRILVSNHGLEFVQGYEDARNRFSFHRIREHGPSMIELSRVIVSEGGVSTDQQFITYAAVVAMVDEVYKPQLNLLDYSFESDGAGITIHSHAAIGLDLIKSLASKFRVPYEDATIFELANTIDEINQKFAVIRDKDKVHTLYKSRDVNDMFDRRYDRADEATVRQCVKSFPVVYLAWSRFQGPGQIERPSEHNGYSLSFVHGHNDEDTVDNIVGLNSAVGQVDNHSGADHVLNNPESSEFLLFTSEGRYFAALKKLRGVQVQPALQAHFDRVIASVKACYRKGDDTALLTRALDYVRDSLGPTTNPFSLNLRLQELTRTLPTGSYSKEWKMAMASLLAFSVIATLLAAAALAMSFTCPLIAPALLSVVIGASSASLGVGSIGVGVFSFAVHQSKQPIENPVSKSLGLFSKKLELARPKVPAPALGATEGSALLAASPSARS